MKKRLSLLAIFCILLGLLLVSCGVKTYQITFVNGDETQVVEVNVGEVIQEPETPTKEAVGYINYVFDGWYNGDVKWNFETDKPEGDLTLTAKFNEVLATYTVTFMNADGSKFAVSNVTHGEKVTAPTGTPVAPVKEGYSYTFEGWYNGEEKWNFENGTVESDLTLTPKFTETLSVYEVQIVDPNGEVIETLSVNHGEKLTKPTTPAAPTEAGRVFEFDGWYNGEAKWDFENDLVTSAMSLRAVFTSELIDVTITFEMEDGQIIETVTVKYGEMPKCSITPAKESTATKVYSFAGWDKEVVNATVDTAYVAQFKEYAVGIGNTDIFTEDTIYNAASNKLIYGCYEYTSISESAFPIAIINEALVFHVFSTDDTGVLNIDFGSVKAGVTYYISMDLIMSDKDGNLLKDGFAYAFATAPNKTASAPELLTSYALLATNGANGFLFTPTQDIEHLYLSIRSQKAKGYMESTLSLDNLCCKEVDLSGADISEGEVTEDFGDGIIVSEGNATIWYGDVKVYSPNLNATVLASDGNLLAKAEKSGQQGLVGFYIDGVKAGKSYEVSMDLKLYDANGEDKTSGFSMMVYANGNFTGTRYNLYVGDTNLQITPTVDKLSTDGKVTFKFTSHADGYVIVALRANSAPLYAEIDNFHMKEVETYAFITFRDESGNAIGNPVKYLAGTEIALPEAPVKEPTDTVVYTFDGWYNGNTKLVAGTKALYDMTYTAKYVESAREYTITYYNDDDTVYQTVKVPYGAAVELIAVPEKDGKTGVWVGDVYATMPAQNISYKASYTVVSYTATITLNGEAYKEYTFTADNKATILANILGEFVNDAQYTYAHEIPAELPLENCEYNVIRTVNEYTVKFVVDGEVKEILTLAYGETPATTLTPSKEGYKFTGWTPAIATVTGDATYTAVFAANSLDLTENFENGSISGKNYTGANLNAVRPNDNSSWELVDYNGSKALAISKLGSVTSGGYAGVKINVNPNTTYVVTLDLAAVGATTADLSDSSAILFEVYENCNIGGSTRLLLFSNTGRWLNNNQKVSSFKSGTKYQVVFTTSDFDGESGYVYFTLRLDKTLKENATVYIDNLHVNECKTVVNENFDDLTSVNDQIAKGANSTVTVENGALKATCTAGMQGFLGVYVKVEANKTYLVNFNATVTGADGTDYKDGTAAGNSATAMIFQNNNGFNNNYRINFIRANGESKNQQPLTNLKNQNHPDYTLKFTATEDGYVYIALRTNNIAQESYITLDNLVVSELELD